MSAEELRIEHLPLSEIKKAPRNPKDHDLGELHASMDRRGFTSPLLMDEGTGTLVAGHGRLEALVQRKKEGKEPPLRIRVREDGEWLVPVVRGLRFKNAAEAEAYLIADNRLVELGGWDKQALAGILSELSTANVLEGTGYDGEDLDGLLEQLNQGRPGDEALDEVPALPKKAIAKPGELWILGEHRLLCGDSREPFKVAKLVASAKPGLMVTDPPYGVGLDMSWRIKAGLQKRAQSDKLKGDHNTDWSDAFRLAAAPVAYVWHAAQKAVESYVSIQSAGYEVRQQLVWVKSNMVISRAAYHWRHEPCWYAVRKGAQANWKAGRDQDTVWEARAPRAAGTTDGDDGKADHPTQKPVELWLRPIRNHTNAGAWIYDPFCGSGTAVIAAQRLDRRCLAIEVEPKYIDVTVQRWEKMTGKSAERASGS